MARLFGTDGVRGEANVTLLPEMAYRLGRAATLYFGKDSEEEQPLIIIGRDTRLSGEMLEAALVAGICSAGGRAMLAGVIPTPAIAYLARKHRAKAGIVISASHNPFHDNGIKFFGGDGYKLPDSVEDELEAIVHQLEENDDLPRAKGSRIVFRKGEASLKGSSSPVAGQWKSNGGGILSRTGCHPLGGILWLKQQEAKNRGEEITITSVVADTGMIQHGLSEHERRYFTTYPQDVEDFGTITVTFSDQSKALIIASDCVLGGTKNYVEVYCNDNALMCNITPPDILNTYFLDEDGLDDVYISEMLPRKLGWNKAFVNDEIIRGYMGELQDFMECVALDREPMSGFQLAYDITKVTYAAYQSAEEGKKFVF